MTEPLLDKEELLRIIRHEFDLSDPVGAADSTIGYLRSVLTPEALTTVGEWLKDEDGVRWARVVTPDMLHRRIFGEGGPK